MRHVVKLFIAIDLCFLAICIYSIYKSYEPGPTVYEPRVVQLYTPHTSCTGFIVGKGLIATAGHCVAETLNEKEAYVHFIDGKEVHYKVLTWSGEHGCQDDWALIMADTGHRPAFDLAEEKPALGAELKHSGHPRGAELEYEATEYYLGEFEGGLFLSGFAIPGESGSPIVNEHKQVVGVLTCSKVNVPMSIGTFIAPLREMVQKLKGGAQ